MYLLLEYAETDLAAIMKKSKPSIPMALYFWSEMLRIMEVLKTNVYMPPSEMRTPL